MEEPREEEPCVEAPREGEPRLELPEGAEGGKPRRPNPVSAKVGEWTERLLGAARSEEGFGGQEAAYEANRTRADYVWNTVGLSCWGVVFPLLTIVVTQLVNVEEAGRFSFAFVVASLLMILGNYGVRTYQVSDRDGTHSFADYQANRVATCVLMMLAGLAFCNLRGDTGLMRAMFLWLFAYRAVDALADCCEGRLQQCDKLYLAGISQTFRSALAFVSFCLVLLISRDLGVASVAMAIAAGITYLVFTLPLALFETPKSGSLSWPSVGRLFAGCAPMFAALFLYALIDNMPKFLMEGTLTYDNQLYFNAMYFPAQAVLLAVGFLYKPMLGRMADAWGDLSRRRRFDLAIVAGVCAVGIVGVLAVGVMAWVGVPLMTLLYGIDFEPFRRLSYLMVVAGGITGAIDFLYQAFAIMRRQAAVLKLYVIAFVFALAVPYMLIRVSGLRGAVLGYLIVMAILLVLLVLEYVRIRMEYRAHPEDDPTRAAAAARAGWGEPDEGEPGPDVLEGEVLSVEDGWDAPVKGGAAAGSAGEDGPDGSDGADDGVDDEAFYEVEDDTPGEEADGLDDRDAGPSHRGA